MTWWVKNFKGKQTSNWFKQNPQNINKKWRPKKWISYINTQLKEKWYSPATKADIEENYMQLLNLPEEELKKLLKNNKQPMLIRIIVKSMLSGKGFDIIEKMLDRWIWKPKQITEDIWKESTIEIKIENKQLLDSLIEE